MTTIRVDRWGWLRALLPSRCPLCLTSHDRPGWLCPTCRSDLPRLGPACPRCAHPLPASQLCGACLHHPPPYTVTIAALAYRDPVDFLIQEFKFHGKLALARDLGRSLAEAVRERGSPLPKALVPIPLHRGRLRERGFDQARELARTVGQELGIPLRRGIRRQRATLAQSLLDREGRRRNVAGAFLARNDLPRHVALVDDVMTTGTTVKEAAGTLLRAGVAEVEIWVVARAGRRGR